jgi:hypothetical protein
MKRCLNTLDGDELEALKRLTENAFKDEGDITKKYRKGGNNRKSIKRKKAKNRR